jgi:hypothetical protein
MTQDTILVLEDQWVPVPQINIDDINRVISEIQQKSVRGVLQ